MEIAVIGTEETITAFRLGGVGRFYSEQKAGEDLKEILRDGGLGVLLVTMKFADENRQVIDAHRRSGISRPVIVEIPNVSEGPVEREDSIDRLLKRAIGVDLGQ